MPEPVARPPSVRRGIAILVSVAISLSSLLAAAPPQAEIVNGPLHAKLYLPDVKQGYYQGTRFDWSGVIYSLEFAGHNYYGPWFNRTNHDVHDFIYDGPDIVAGPCSAITGPVDEFAPLDWDEVDDRKLGPQSYNLRNVRERLEKTDPWRDMRKHAKSLSAARKALDSLK